MPRTTRSEIDPALLDQLLAVGDGALPLAHKVEMAQGLRASMPHHGVAIDQFLLEQLEQHRLGLMKAEAVLGQLREVIARLEAPPWFPAYLLGCADTDRGARAIVVYNGSRRLVGFGAGLEQHDLLPGEEVFLNGELNAIMGRSPYRALRCGETASFQHRTADGRLVLRWRDEDVVVEAAASLNAAALHSGDQLRWNRDAGMAFEVIEHGAGRQSLLTEVPDVDPTQVGGQAAALDRLLLALTATLVHPDLAARYQLDRRRSVLMVGPPGVGKTLMARAAVTAVRRLSGKACHFTVVKPAEWESCWVGETEENIRRCFKELKKFGLDGPAVLFLDEIESIGRVRGGGVSQHADRFLAALLAELDGFSSRDGVAIVAATNRKDLVDPALLERLSDVEITVRRPDLRAARAIFDIHLPAALPYGDGEMRDALIDSAVSRLYSPNADDNALCQIRFRDGRTRTVAARELVSGRLIQQLGRTMCMAAFRRETRGGAAGLCRSDMEDAVAETIERLRTTLTPRNAHAYLADLPQDVDVVSVEPIARRVNRPHRYMNAA